MGAVSTDVIPPREGKFQDVIKSPAYQEKFKATLPQNVSLAAFTAVVLRAVQEDPKLLAPDTDKASLFLSCQRAAQDGLMPDKREGALVMYGNKVQWQPMIGGLRKVLAAAGFDLRAECVYENDTFDYELGDQPTLTHKAAKLGTPRGAMIGAYSVATNLETGEKYREVMSMEQLNAVAAVSRAGSSGPWKGPFKDEMYRKTVARRNLKQLPIDNRRLQEIIDRDNENFDLETPTQKEASPAAKKVQDAVRGRKPEPEPVADDRDTIDAEFTSATRPAAEDDGPEGDF